MEGNEDDDATRGQLLTDVRRAAVDTRWPPPPPPSPRCRARRAPGQDDMIGGSRSGMRETGDAQYGDAAPTSSSATTATFAARLRPGPPTST